MSDKNVVCFVLLMLFLSICALFDMHIKINLANKPKSAFQNVLTQSTRPIFRSFCFDLFKCVSIIFTAKGQYECNNKRSAYEYFLECDSKTHWISIRIYADIGTCTQLIKMDHFIETHL